MFTLPRSVGPMGALAGAAVALALTSAVATAQSSRQSAMCMKGEVAASDYSELSQSFREGGWDRSSGVELVTDNESLALSVVDVDNNSVCTEAETEVEPGAEAGDAPRANPKNRCNFSLVNGDRYTITIDNRAGTSRANYRVCPF